MLKFAFLMLFIFATTTLLADAKEGEALERKIWEHTKNHEWDKLEAQIAPYFQLATISGVFNRGQYFDRAKKLDAGDYTISNLKITEGPNSMVITYDIGITETIDGRRISSKANRLSVWEKNGDSWKWIAHAILMPITAKEAKQD